MKAAFINIFVCLLPFNFAWADTFQVRNYAIQDGLDNLVVDQIAQDPTGYIYFCTQHGVYFYDGKKILNLATEQGLPIGGFSARIAFDQNGRVLILTPHQIFISNGHTDSRTSPLSLHFENIKLSGISFSQVNFRWIAVRGNDVFIDDDGQLDFVDLSKRNKEVVQRASSSNFSFIPKLDNITNIFSEKKNFWIMTEDGNVYIENSGKIHREKLPHNKGDPRWQGWYVDEKGIVYLSSFKNIAAFKEKKILWIRSVPGNSWKHAMNISESQILVDREGDVLTQTGNKISINRSGVWLPALGFQNMESQILAMFLDKDHQLWFGTEGTGAYRLLGWRVWENFNEENLKTPGNIWQIIPIKNDFSLLFSDNGMLSIGKDRSVTLYDRSVNYIGSIDQSHRIWRVINENELENFILDKENNILNRRSYNISNIISLSLGRLADNTEVIWIATQNGLFFLPCDAPSGETPHQVMGDDGKPLLHLYTLMRDNDGSIWLIKRGELLHRHVDGSYVKVVSEWPVDSFVPITMTRRGDNEIWVGGAGGGVMRLSLDGDHLLSLKQFTEPDILSSSVASLLVDRRQWVWVGTDRGISVFDGQRWVSQNTNDGLIWNDISQDGLAEGVDGTIWISTSRGVSHLLKPESVFQHQTLRPVFSEVRLGNKLLPEQAVDFSRQPLTVRFGILNFAAQANVHFRYRLEDVDSAWADTASGEVRYAYVPPGQHNLTVQAYDTMRGDQSEPISLLIRMKYPWWQWWTAYIAYVLTIAACFYAIMRFRFRYLTRRQAILKELVEQRTKEMRAAQQALEVQAQQDGLTGLLNRRTIEANLSRLLARMRDQTRSGLSGTNVTAILMDIDYFKSINDEFGHLVGDEVLIEVSARLQKAVRLEDLVGRYGGEEFLITVSISGSEMRERIQEIMRKLTDRPISTRKGELAVRCSMGVAEAGTNEDWQSLIDRADQALYQAKAAGRNRIVFSELAPNGADYPS